MIRSNRIRSHETTSIEAIYATAIDAKPADLASPVVPFDKTRCRIA